MKSIPLTAGTSINFELHKSSIGGNEHRRKIIEAIHLFIVLGLILFICACGNLFLEGPFNKETMVPPLLYHNNGTNLVTFWDEDLQEYRTFDQQLDIFLSEAVFNIDPYEGRSNNYEVVGLSVAPMTHLDEQGLLLQNEQGCIACHQK